MPNMQKNRAGRNRTITLADNDTDTYRGSVGHLREKCGVATAANSIFNEDFFSAVELLPDGFADLLILDPPYNMNKTFKSNNFKKMSIEGYTQWFEKCLVMLLPKLKETSSVYVCCDWFSATAVHLVLEKYLKVRNRITWERDKGRGAKKNWKNSSEDIFFATVSNNYTFNLESVKMLRKVIAPYTDEAGDPKDWLKTDKGAFRITHPSNLWNDITVPFWSMPENTDHPTQKPEKLLAKLILASSNEGDIVFDPFMGVGSSCITAKKLGRQFTGIELEEEYCLLAAKRLAMAETNKTIQGVESGVFLQRNTPGSISGKISRQKAD